MKKHIFFLLTTLFGSGLCFANESEPPRDECPDLSSSFTYFSIGAGPMPAQAVNLGLGRRFVCDPMAIDVGVSASSFGIVNSLQAHLHALKYFHQQPTSQWYAGIGGSIDSPFGIWDYSKAFVAAPNLILGREYLNSKGGRRFFQVESMYPLFPLKSGECINSGLVTVKYGIGF
jgi:hypothetical protein